MPAFCSTCLHSEFVSLLHSAPWLRPLHSAVAHQQADTTCVRPFHVGLHPVGNRSRRGHHVPMRAGNLEQCPIPRPPWTPHFLNTRRLDSQHRSLSPRGTSRLHVALSWRRCSAAGYRQLLRQPDYALFRLILAHSRRHHESSMHLNLLICSKGPVMVASHTTAHTNSYQLSLPMPIPILVQN